MNFSTNGQPVYLVDHKQQNYTEGLIFGQTKQISMNRGVKVFGDAGHQSVRKEIKQLHERKVPIPVDPDNQSHGSISTAIKYLMFLKMKRDISIKGRVCDDVWIQHKYRFKEESRYPIVSTESLMLSRTIDALERENITTVDIPRAFMQADTH